MLLDTVNNAYSILTVILRAQFVECTPYLATMLRVTLKVLILAFQNKFIIFETKGYCKQAAKVLDHMPLVFLYA